ncbi:MAG: cytochrome c3 family protein [Myxococcota bacterium]
MRRLLLPFTIAFACAKPSLPAETPAAAPLVTPQSGAQHPTLGEGLTTMDEVRTKMKRVGKALGVKCDHCHDTSDFAAPSAKKAVANLMHARMTGNLTTSDGKEIFCEHCHAGRATFLDRSDEEALKSWMKENFVEKLTTKDGSKMDCDTCHRGARWKFLPRAI